jgi:putative redox protein
MLGEIAVIKVALNFSNTFNGALKTDNGMIHIGKGENLFSPYELLGGALGSCLYSTFLDIIKKMRLSFEEFGLDIEIEKRTEAPYTAKYITIKSAILGSDREKDEKYKRAFTLATENCSIFSTLSHVAEIKWTLDFK